MIRILAEADYACFTRPECKVERVSYNIPTPSALIGMLKAVYWKPAMRYVIDKIVVFNQIKQANIRRNEVKSKVSYATVKSRMNGGERSPVIYTKEDISQRAATVLKDVKYGVEFHIELTGLCSEKGEETVAKHCEILKRRLQKGQYFHAPCMGCREFPVKSITLAEEFDLNAVDASLKGETDPGIMLHSLVHHDAPQLKEKWDSKYFSDSADPRYYHPLMTDGVIDVAKYAKEAGI